MKTTRSTPAFAQAATHGAGAVDVHGPQARIVRGAVADDTGHMEHARDAVERPVDRRGVEHVALDDLRARAVEPRGRGRRAHERAHLPVAAPQLAHELGAEIARGSGDQGAHGGLAYPRRSGRARAVHWCTGPT